MITIAVITLLSMTSAHAQGTVKVTFNELESNEGQVLVCLFDNDNGFPGKIDRALHVEKVAVTDRQAQHTFSNLPLGSYAVSVVHDEDGNDEIKKNWMGMPKEKVGMSNVSGGMPSFEKAMFTLTPHQPTTEIVIKPFN